MRRRLAVLAGLMAAALVLTGCSPAASPPNMPPWMQKAPAQVQDTYAFAVAHPEVLESVPCYCGCTAMGHKSNKDCFIQGVAPDGKVTYDIHAAGWNICIGIARDAKGMWEQGKSPKEIRAAVDAGYAQFGPGTRTPLPQ